MLSIQKKLSNSFFGLISLPSTAMGFALSIQISALSWILSTKFNLNIHEIGIVWAAGPLAGIFGQVIIGLISDKVWFWGGRRKPFILIGGTLAALMLLALPNIIHIANIIGFLGLLSVAILVALLLDLAINVSFNPTRSIIADVTPEGELRTKGFTWMQTISGFFGVLAYVVGAVWGNYVLIYFGAFVVFLFSIVPTLLIEEPRNLVAATSDFAEKSIAVEKKTNFGQLLRIYFAHGFSWIGIQTMFVYIIAFIKQKIVHDNDMELGAIISISFAVLNTIGFILPALVLKPLSDKFGRIKIHILSITIMALGYFGIVFFGFQPIILYSFMAIIGIGWGAVVSLPFAIMSEKVEKSKMGFYMGIFNLSVVIPQLIVSLVLGYFINQFENKSLIFVICGVSLSISAFLWLLVKEDKK